MASNFSKIDTVSHSTFSKRKLLFQFILILSIIGSAIFTIIAFRYDYLSWDIQISHYLQKNNLPILDIYLLLITWLGNSLGIILLLGLFTIFLLTVKKFKDALFVLVSTVGIILMSETLKTIINRPRPTADLINTIIPNLPAGSFPSGHVLFFCGFFGSILFLTYTRLQKSWLRDILIVGLLMLIFSAGISRVYLGAHWASDVAGSYFIGFIWLYLMSFVYRYLKLR